MRERARWLRGRREGRPRGSARRRSSVGAGRRGRGRKATLGHRMSSEGADEPTDSARFAGRSKVIRDLAGIELTVRRIIEPSQSQSLFSSSFRRAPSSCKSRIGDPWVPSTVDLTRTVADESNAAVMQTRRPVELDVHSASSFLSLRTGRRMSTIGFRSGGKDKEQQRDSPHLVSL